MRGLSVLLLLTSTLTACMIPGSYYDPSDMYVRGLRWFDRDNFVQARNDWEPLAKAGDCDAQFRLGTLYFLGAGVPQDFEAARGYWVTAANQGQAIAQYLLAIMYAHEITSVSTAVRKVRFDCARGCGVAKNLVEASKWAALSAKFAVYDGNRKSAEEIVISYRQSMSQEQIAESEKGIQTWRPSTALCKQRKLL